VVHELGVEDLVGETQVVLILAPLHELGHGALVVVARHRHLPARPATIMHHHVSHPPGLCRAPGVQ